MDRSIVDENALPSLLRPEVFVATVAGAGFVPKAPGTMGAMVAAIALASPLVREYALALLVAIMLVGTWASAAFMRNEGSHDPGEIVIDEVAGIFTAFETALVLTLLEGYYRSIQLSRLYAQGEYVLAEELTANPTPWWPQLQDPSILSLLLLFLLFRLFDIAKPWPVGAIDKKMDGALGVMLDDVAAGVQAGIAWFVLMLAYLFFTAA